MKILIPILFSILSFNLIAATRPQKLSKLQFEVTKKGATEPAYKNEYWDNKRPGIYVDINTGEALFSSLDKYDSGTGWPSFTKSIDEKKIEIKLDFGFGFPRKEVRSKGGHLGHVFNDGPKDRGGKRYCINSAALWFIPLDELEKEGYGQYLDLFKDVELKPSRNLEE